MPSKNAAENTWYLLNKLEEERLVRDNCFAFSAAQPTSAHAGLYRYDELSDAYVEPATRETEWYSVEDLEAEAWDILAEADEEPIDEVAEERREDMDLIMVAAACWMLDCLLALVKRLPRPKPEPIPVEEQVEEAHLRFPASLSMRKSVRLDPKIRALRTEMRSKGKSTGNRDHAAESRTHSRQKRPWQMYA